LFAYGKQSRFATAFDKLKFGKGTSRVQIFPEARLHGGRKDRFLAGLAAPRKVSQ